MVRLVGHIAALAALAGCDVVFGSAFDADEVVDGARADADGGDVTQQVQGRLVRRYVTDSLTGPLVSPQPHGSTELTPTVWQDGESLPIDWDYATGTFSFRASRGRPYRLVLDFGMGVVHEIQSTRESIALADTIYDRPTATPTSTTPTIAGAAPDLPIDSLLVSTGVWSQVPMAVQPATSSYAATWPRGKRLLDTTQGDRLFAVHYETTGDYRRIDRASGPLALTMGPGANSLAIPTEPRPPGSCTLVTAPTTALDTALADTYGEYGSVAAGWGLYATPDLDVGPNLFYTLVESVAASAEARYYDPFTTFAHVGLVQAIRERAVTTSATTSIPIRVVTRTVTTVTRNTCVGTSPPTELPGDRLVIPTGAILGDTALATDSVIIELGAAREVVLSWSAPDAELHTLSLYNVTDLTDAAELPLRRIGFYRSTEPRVVIQTDALQPDQYYLALMAGTRGFVNAAAGDFTRATYPNATGLGASSSFRVSK